MKYTVLLRPEADNDLRNARKWYERRQSGLGSEFLLSVRTQLVNIQDQPESFAVCYQNVRSVTMKRFPYVIFFRIKESVVEVIAVIHGRRDPRVWKRRASRN